MNVVIYARYSSRNQTEQSIEGQIAVCTEYAKRNNYTIIGEYIDRAMTGTNDNRPEFQKMINDSNKKSFQGVLVYQFDRFARNRYDSATYKNKLKKNNVRVFSAKENISEDASGVLMESLLEGMAEYYSVELSQKVKRGMRINAEKFLYNGGTIPLGLIVNKDKKYEIDTNTAPIVKEIFNMYINGKTMAEIIKYLNDKNIKTSYGNNFNKNSIRTILENKKYVGIYSYKGTDTKNAIPAIIDEATFQKVQGMLNKNKVAPARAKAKTEYLLTTKLFCGTCKEMMVGVCGTSRSGAVHNYYSCNGKRKNKCDRKNIQKDLIEKIVVEETRNMLTDENIDRIANTIFQYAEKAKNNNKTKELEQKLKTNEKHKNNLFCSLKICEIDSVRKSIFEEIAKMEEEHKNIERELLLEKKANVDTTVEEIKTFFLNIKKYSTNELIYKRILINSFIDKIYIYDNNITIIYTVKDKVNNSIKIPSIEEIECSYLNKHGQPK